MRIKQKYIAILTSLCICSACSDTDEIPVVENTGIHPIALHVGNCVGGGSRASVVTDNTGSGFTAFTAPTDILMLIQSDYETLSDAELNYGGSHSAKYCATMGSAAAGIDDNTYSEVSFTDANTRYWDDAHARSSALSVWAVAVPNKTGAITSATPWTAPTTWSTTAPTDKNIVWSIGTAQNQSVVEGKDLCFSNNLVNYTPAPGTDRRIKYGTQTALHFDQGELVFYHALTKITIVMNEGDGFDHESTTDFNFDNVTSEQSTANAVPLILRGFKLGGTFDVADGTFSSQDDAATAITSMYNKEKTATGYTLQALVMPGKNMSSNQITDAVEFSIDGSKFKVSSATLLEKIREGIHNDSWTTMEAGKNYIFTFTVNKTDIEVTATVKGWDDVVGANYAPLINITTSFGQEGENFGKGFSFLRSLNLSSDYSNDTDVTYADGEYTMATPLYWPDHQTHYFFRGVWPLIGSGTPSANVTDEKIAVANVAYSAETYPSILMLGYPRTTDETCVHGTEVATDGICATEGDIRMNFQYAMSRVEVILQTIEGSSKVTFDEHTTVEITGCYSDGNILLSDGSSDFTDKSTGAYEMHRNGGSNTMYHDAIIPQSLEGLKFVITVQAEDSHIDKYETVLGIADIPITAGASGKISEWEPGKHYTYTLTITKTGIKVVATIKDWINSNGSTNIWM